MVPAMTQKPRHFIREWRNARNLTLADLSARTGLSAAAISRIETGGAAYTENTLGELASCLHCSPADLISRDPSDPESIQGIWDQLTPADQQTARALLVSIRALARGRDVGADPRLDNSTPGERLREARRRGGFSASELGAAVGLSESAVRNQENGTNGFSADTAKAYAALLDVTPEWLLFGVR